MSAPEDQISDNELLDIIEKVLCNEFSENDENQMLNILTNRFPNIVNIIFHSKIIMTPSKILEEVKKSDKPIQL